MEWKEGTRIKRMRRMDADFFCGYIPADCAVALAAVAAR
jgi:hypothetical protein